MGMEWVQQPRIHIQLQKWGPGAINNIDVAPHRFRSSLKVYRLTGACLQGGFAECL